jgi:hypothetical protein
LAHADEDVALSRARAKFQQGTELEQAGDFAAALQAFRDVGQVRMTPQVRFHIASCEEKLGRLGAAIGGFELALAEAGAIGPEFQTEVEGRISALRTRIPKLVIERGQGAQSATIELDGVTLGARSIGTEVPLDPGPHSILAKAPGYKRYVSTIEVEEQQVKKLTIALEEIQTAPVETLESSDASNTSNTSNTSPPDVAPAPRPARIVPYVVGGIGAAALVNAGVFYLLRRGKDSDLQALCGSDHNCTNANPRPLVGDEVSRSRDLDSKMRLYTTVSSISVVTGIVALGVAGAWVVAEPKQAKPITAWLIQPSAPGAELGGLSVVSTF